MGRKYIATIEPASLRQHSSIMETLIAFILSISAGVIPLLIRLQLIILDKGTARTYTGESSYYDVFNYLKAKTLIIVLVVMISFWLIRLIQKRMFPIDRILIPLGIYSIFLLASAIFSPYPWVASHGFPDRLEGLFVLFAYVLLTVSAALIIKSDKVRATILGVTMAGSIIIAALGVSQYLGKDFLQTTRGKSLFIPDEYAVMFDKLTFNFGANIMYVTVYNPNYLGSYSALLLPIAVMLLFYWIEKKSFLSILGFLFIGANFLLWIGGMSRAGLLGGVFALLVLIVLGIRSFLRHWKATALIILMCSVLFSGMDQLSQGAVTREFRNTLPAFIESRLSDKKVSWNPFILQLNAQESKVTTTASEVALEVAPEALPEAVPETTPVPTGTPRLGASGLPLVLSTTLENNRFRFETATETLVVLYEEGAMQLLDEKDQPVNHTINQTPIDDGGFSQTIAFNDPRYAQYSMRLVSGGLLLQWNWYTIPLIVVDDTLTVNTKQGVYESKIISPEVFGFEGQEVFASNRGYIWSRSIPLLKQTILLGKGPDTYAIVFPQTDIAGKINWMSDNNMLVDKPHNWYLQMGINTGVVSLIAMLVFLAWYLLRGIRVKNEPALGDGRLIHIGILSGVVGYLVAAMFNDSNVSVSPVFWVMLGLGLSYVITANNVRTTTKKASIASAPLSKQHPIPSPKLSTTKK